MLWADDSLFSFGWETPGDGALIEILSHQQIELTS